MSRFVDIDLSQLPAPDAIEGLDYEQLVAEGKATLLALLADDPELQAEVAVTLQVESEPLVKILEAMAYRELIVRGRVNDAVRAVLLATTRGADLDNLAARLGVERMTITPATDTAPAVMETDAALKDRYQLAPEAFSVAGPYGAYEFHARSAHPKVKDAGVYGPESGLVDPGQTLTVILSHDGTGAPSQSILDAVQAKLSHEDTVPDTDEVLVRGATIVTYDIHYRLQIRAGADAALIVAQARRALTAYADTADAYAAAVAAGYAGTAEQFRNLPYKDGGANPRRVGGVVALSALASAAHQDRVNVVRAVRLSPTLEVDPGLDGAPWCASVTVDYEIVGG